jgi:FkbM family methyltransferase
MATPNSRMSLFDPDRLVPRQNWLGRSLRWPLDRVPKEMAMPILSGPLLARRWIVGAGIHRCWLGTYERRKQLALKAHLERDMVACDIGANAGFYSLLMARRVGVGGRVFAFEPQPSNLDFLRRHLELNRVRNVQVSGEAVADFVGEASFATDPGSYKGCLHSTGAIRVQVETLDNLVTAGRIEPADLLKIDVEGAELAVLRGGEKFLKRFRPVIFLATHGPELHRACCDLLRDCGYRLRALEGHREIADVDEIIATTR